MDASGGQYVVDLREIGRGEPGDRLALVGGKAANLGELNRIEGIDVPPGFCLTTTAFDRGMARVPGLGELLDELSAAADGETSGVAVRIRAAIERAGLPGDVATAIAGALRTYDTAATFAVRSSATAEDLPTASFAGQQDSYLNIVGAEAICAHVVRCWASLFTDRAVVYRRRADVDHRTAHMAVVVQQMVDAEASGVLFTADPVSGHRRRAQIEAIKGLGEALVSGLVTPDRFTVQHGEVLERELTNTRRPALTDARAVTLAGLGRRVEQHFGRPQDIEWCLARNGSREEFRFVQSRPITTLFPLPDIGDDAPHVYLSVGHQQMMTDAMTPLGLSVFQLTAAATMYSAGGRLFVDVAPRLAGPGARTAMVEMISRAEPLMGNALRTALDTFMPDPDDRGDGEASRPAPPTPAEPEPLPTDHAVVGELVRSIDASIAAAAAVLAGRTGPDLFDAMIADVEELKRSLFNARSLQVIMAGMDAVQWLRERMREWLDEPNAGDVLTQSLPDNVTAQMGLDLLDVADVIRPHPHLVAFLQQRHRAGDAAFLDRLGELPGGAAARSAVEGWLDRYGMRGPGEIDITRPRWRERPDLLLPLILGNVRNFEPGSHARLFAQGLESARQTEQSVLARLRGLPDGERRAAETKRMIEVARTFSGYREYPKYGIIARYFVYKRALLAEADRLAAAGVLREPDDASFLTFAEFHDASRTRRADRRLIERRRQEFDGQQALTPPRVMTSDGEVFNGGYRRTDLPDGALAGLAVSAGTVEGRARVLLRMTEADLEPGDILVTPHTDPSWTPLFVGLGGLVTEVGGLMTHGAVIAREYGLPAVVGVVDATRLIPDGQRIRVHGTEGYVEVLS